MKKKGNKPAQAKHFVIWGKTGGSISGDKMVDALSDKIAKGNEACLKKMSKKEREKFGNAILENCGTKFRLKG